MTGLKSNEYNINPLNSPTIGSPIFCFTKSECVLNENEIWLEGALVKIESYPLLFKEYGYDYTPEDVAAPPDGYFYLKDWRNRSIWGSPDGTFGYLKATAPNITGSLGSVVEHTATEAFRLIERADFVTGAVNKLRLATGVFNAHNSDQTYQDGATVRPPSIKCRVKTRYR